MTDTIIFYSFIANLYFLPSITYWNWFQFISYLHIEQRFFRVSALLFIVVTWISNIGGNTFQFLYSNLTFYNFFICRWESLLHQNVIPDKTIKFEARLWLNATYSRFYLWPKFRNFISILIILFPIHGRHEGRLGILDLLPTDSLKEWMIFNLVRWFRTKSIPIIIIKQFPHQIVSNRTDRIVPVSNIRPCYVKLLNVADDLIHCVRTEGSASYHHLVGNYAQRPPIYA